MPGYTQQTDPDTTARRHRQGGAHSPKFSREICRMLRGRRSTVAIKMLEEVIELKRPVPIRRYNIGVAHKTGVGPGRFPKKAAKAIHQGHRERQEQRGVQGTGRGQHEGPGHSRPPGADHPGTDAESVRRSTQWNQQTVNIEVILEEVE